MSVLAYMSMEPAGCESNAPPKRHLLFARVLLLEPATRRAALRLIGHLAVEFNAVRVRREDEPVLTIAIRINDDLQGIRLVERCVTPLVTKHDG